MKLQKKNERVIDLFIIQFNHGHPMLYQRILIESWLAYNCNHGLNRKIKVNRCLSNEITFSILKEERTGTETKLI